MLNTIALRRLHCWIAPKRSRQAVQAKICALELGQLGFRFQNPEQLTDISRSEFTDALSTLKAMRGGNVTYVPLFNNFPDDLPNDHEYLLRRLLGCFGIDTFGDKASFGADPITQMQREDYWQAAAQAQRQKLADAHTEWIALTVISPAEAQQRLERWSTDLVYSATPVKEALWEDLLWVIEELQIAPDLDRIVVKETLARLAAQQWLLWGQVVVKTPTDLLRMFAFLQDQDVSLATPINLKGLKFLKPQRRAVMCFLNTCPALGEDLLRYRRLWISISRWLHPGDFVKQFPRVVQVFDDLRNDRLQSFDAQVLNTPPKQSLALLQTRPSMLLRKVGWLLQQHPTETIAQILLELDEQAQNLPLPLLANVFCALKDQRDRLIINKQGKPYTIAKRVDLGDVSEVLAAVESLILTQLQGSKNWRTVWVDPAIDKLVLPLQARKQSDGLLNLARGSRIPLTAPVVRLFVYWHQRQHRTDLDLSVLKLDTAFKYAGQVSWNQYGKGKDIAHSGDIQSAPRGAAEFIDLRLAALKTGYLLPVVLRYAGESFTAMRACYAGWMLRQQVGGQNQAFDAKTVAEKVDVHQDGRVWIPFLLDVAAQELVCVDLYAKGENMVERNPHFSAMAAAIAHYWQTKPTFGLLAKWYVQANRATLCSKANAQVKIGLTDDCTINVLNLVGQGVTSFSTSI
ncbi:MAG: TerD family protein [Spirulina sp. SIO3F2]|nr:TerD family protein [Spirulina sp. SIO3F2]